MPDGDVRDIFRDRITTSANAKLDMAGDDDLLDTAAAVADAMMDSLRAGGKVMFFGNGGSSMDAGHLAAELLGRYYLDRPSLAAVALSDSTAAMTAIGNDFGYELTFARQVEGLARTGDVVVGLSTSGNSPNVVAGLRRASEIGAVTVAFTGAKGGAVTEIADLVLQAPSTDTPRIQECHMVLGHTICELVERAMVEGSAVGGD